MRCDAQNIVSQGRFDDSSGAFGWKGFCIRPPPPLIPHIPKPLHVPLSIGMTYFSLPLTGVITYFRNGSLSSFYFVLLTVALGQAPHTQNPRSPLASAVITTLIPHLFLAYEPQSEANDRATEARASESDAG